jgi:hypothetical protein
MCYNDNTCLSVELNAAIFQPGVCIVTSKLWENSENKNFKYVLYKTLLENSSKHCIKNMYQFGVWYHELSTFLKL